MFKALTRALFVAGITALFVVPSVASAQTYNVDNSHSQTLFNITHFNAGSFYGQFLKMEGKLTLTGKTKAAISVTVDAASVFTNNKKRDAHLKGADFFNAKQFPKIKFEGTARGLLRRYRASGTLSFRGIKKKVKFFFKVSKEVKDPWGNTRVGAVAKLTISRKAFGMTYMAKGLGDKVNLIISLELVKEKPAKKK